MAHGSKREKRLRLQAEQREEFEKKKARQIVEPSSLKVPVAGASVDAKKVVLSIPPGRQKVSWIRTHADVSESWSWGPRSCLDDDWDETIHPFLVLCEAKTWNEIDTEKTGQGKKRRRKHVRYPVEIICKEAQKRLIELERDDIDALFRFRLSGLERLFGTRVAEVFSVLWWDPKHQIYPTKNE